MFVSVDVDDLVLEAFQGAFSDLQLSIDDDAGRDACVVVLAEQGEQHLLFFGMKWGECFPGLQEFCHGLEAVVAFLVHQAEVQLFSVFCTDEDVAGHQAAGHIIGAAHDAVFDLACRGEGGLICLKKLLLQAAYDVFFFAGQNLHCI